MLDLTYTLNFRLFRALTQYVWQTSPDDAEAASLQKPFLLLLNVRNKKGDTIFHRLIKDRESDPTRLHFIIDMCKENPFLLNPFIEDAKGRMLVELFEEFDSDHWHELGTTGLVNHLIKNHFFIGANLEFKAPIASEASIIALTSKFTVEKTLAPRVRLIYGVDDFIEINEDSSWKIENDSEKVAIQSFRFFSSQTDESEMHRGTSLAHL